MYIFNKQNKALHLFVYTYIVYTGLENVKYICNCIVKRRTSKKYGISCCISLIKYSTCFHKFISPTYVICYLLLPCILLKEKMLTLNEFGRTLRCLKVHKIENFFGSDFEFCTISLLVMFKY
jgi:hypothetical protein